MSEESGVKAYDFWRTKLNGAKHILAPMVDASELPFRLLCRKYGAQLCYTPMLHAQIFIRDHKYRRDNLMTNDDDRPLIVQFCSNDPETLLTASKLAAPYCDAIDLNLGCPQSIAKRGHYGAFLQDEWSLISQMIKRVHNAIEIPITCKIRVFPEIEKTIEYAKMLENAGVSIISVHGRTRDQKGPLTGLANWEHIKAVKKSVNVPVFANGNILTLNDIERCLTETGCDGVMSAEGCLYNPSLFIGKNLPVWTFAEQYLEYVHKYSCPLSFSRGHLFKLFHHCFTDPSNEDLREELAKGHSIEVFANVTKKLKERYEKEYETLLNNFISESSSLPPFLSQPYIRPQPKLPLNECLIRRTVSNEDLIIAENADNGNVKLSKKKLKRLNRRPIIKEKKEKNESCVACPNRRGQKCDFSLCKCCCRNKSYNERIDCIGHKFLFKNKLINRHV